MLPIKRVSFHLTPIVLAYVYILRRPIYAYSYTRKCWRDIFMTIFIPIMGYRCFFWGCVGETNTIDMLNEKVRHFCGPSNNRKLRFSVVTIPDFAMTE